MPVSSNALKRFLIYDQCLSFSPREYTMEDILTELRKEENKVLKKSGSGKTREGIEIRIRQFQKDLKAIEENWGIQIERIRRPGKKTIYRYKNPEFTIFSYDNLPKENNLLRLRDTLFLLQQFKGLPHFEFLKDLVNQDEDDQNNFSQKKIVDFDSNDDLIGLRSYFSRLVIAIQMKIVLRIKYNAAFRTKKNIILSPYYLKEYGNRWFLLGNEKGYRSISNIALDRIELLEYAPDEEYTGTDIDFEHDYFENVIGITIPKKASPVKVVLKFSEERFAYVESKPLHGSQKADKENRLVKIEVIHNKELESLILHYGSDVEVLEPESLRNDIKEKITKMYNMYECRK